MSVEEVKVSTTVKETGEKRSATFKYDIPTSLEEALQRFPGTGENPSSVVFAEFLAGFLVSIQAPARKALYDAEGLREGEDEESYKGRLSREVQDFMKSWTLGQKSARGPRTPKDPVASLAAIWDTLSEERKMEIAEKFGFSVPSSNEAGKGGRGKK